MTNQHLVGQIWIFIHKLRDTCKGELSNKKKQIRFNSTINRLWNTNKLKEKKRKLIKVWHWPIIDIGHSARKDKWLRLFFSVYLFIFILS